MPRPTRAAAPVALAATLAAALALGSPAVASGWRVAQAATNGEAAYNEDCASCHRTPARFMRRYLEMPPAERAAALDRFLPDHYAPDPAKRAAIIAWLMTYQPR